MIGKRFSRSEIMSWWTINRKKGTTPSFTIAGILVVAAVLVTLFSAVILPSMLRKRGSELRAAMYRTEANLVAIESAIRAYRDRYEALPPSGKRGLELAVEELNRDVVFYPEGVPKDGWGQDYVYVNADDYEGEHSLAIRDAGSELCHNPRGYQLYSVGSDGKGSPEDGPMAGDRLNDDNINNWDGKRSWRTVYRLRSQAAANFKEE
jgi:type II secretory pathway pseudopilin PulG